MPNMNGEGDVMTLSPMAGLNGSGLETLIGMGVSASVPLSKRLGKNCTPVHSCWSWSAGTSIVENHGLPSGTFCAPIPQACAVDWSLPSGPRLMVLRIHCFTVPAPGLMTPLCHSTPTSTKIAHVPVVSQSSVDDPNNVPFAPPVASERVVTAPDGLVRIALKKPFSDGTVAVDLDPLSLLCRLAATVPPPRFHTVRYAGVLSSHAKWRRLVVPKPASDAAGDATCRDRASDTDAPKAAGASRYRPWAELLRRTFGIDVETCHRCGGRMRLLALVTERNNVARFLRQLGEPTEPPPRAPARDPPYWQSRVLRRRHDEPSRQMGLFEEH